jgi:DNA-binding NarL/FixJ family response regulator
MATMHDERTMMREAFEAGCSAFLVKPHGFMELFKRVQNVVKDPSCLEKLHGLIFDQYGPRPWRAGE